MLRVTLLLALPLLLVAHPTAAGQAGGDLRWRFDTGG